MIDRRIFLSGVASTVASGLLVESALLPTNQLAPPDRNNDCYPILKADQPNSNRRIYSRAILEKAVQEFQQLPSGSLMGQLGMPTSAVLQLKDVSHVIEDLFIEGDYLKAKISVLTTPNGKILQELIEKKAVTFRTAGSGCGKVDDNGFLHIDDSYKLIGIHALPIHETTKL